METWAAVAARAAHAVLRRKRRRLLQAICASGVVLLLEAAGGAVAHSLALMSDATHMLADISSYGIALIAVQVRACSKGSSKGVPATTIVSCQTLPLMQASMGPASILTVLIILRLLT